MSQFQNPAPWNVTTTATVFRIDYNDTNAFITTYHPTDARNIITAIFVVLNVLIAGAGGELLKSNARRTLNEGHTVRVSHLVPWLDLSGIAKYSWKLRCLPGGWLGMLMVFTGSFAVLHQFLTNTLVRPISVPTRCVFDYGSVISTEYFSSAPAPEDDGAALVYQSQLSTLKNQGVQGIYYKIFAENEVQMFRPESEDSHGAWSCVNVMNKSVPWTGPPNLEGTPAGINENTDWPTYLNDSAYMYSNGPMAYQGSSVGDLINEFFIWSTDSDSNLGVVRISVLNPASLATGTPQAMNFDCSLTLDQSAPQVQTSAVLQNWAPKAAGYIKPLDTLSDTITWLELTLNAITTLSLFNDNMGPHNIVPATDIGCVVDGTRVSVGLLVILVMLVLVLAGLLLAESSLLLLSTGKRGPPRASWVPVDLADWQLATLRQSKKQPALPLRALRTAAYHYNSADDMLGLHTVSAENDERHIVDDSADFETFEMGRHGAVEYNVSGPASSAAVTSQIRRKPVLASYSHVPSAVDHE